MTFVSSSKVRPGDVIKAGEVWLVISSEAVAESRCLVDDRRIVYASPESQIKKACWWLHVSPPHQV